MQDSIINIISNDDPICELTGYILALPWTKLVYVSMYMIVDKEENQLHSHKSYLSTVVTVDCNIDVMRSYRNSCR